MLPCIYNIIGVRITKLCPGLSILKLITDHPIKNRFFYTKPIHIFRQQFFYFTKIMLDLKWSTVGQNIKLSLNLNELEIKIPNLHFLEFQSKYSILYLS